MIALTVCAVTPNVTISDVLPAILASAGCAAFAVFIGVVGGVDEPGFWTNPAPTAPCLNGHRLRTTSADAAGYFVVVAMAGGASAILGLEHGYWAMITTVVPLAATDTPGRLLRAGHRVVGTYIGLAVGAVLLSANPNGIAAVVIIVVLQAALTPCTTARSW